MLNEARFIAPNATLTGNNLEIYGHCEKPRHLGTWIGYYVTITAGSARVKIGPCVDVSSYAYISTHFTGKRITEAGPKIVGPVEIGHHSYIGPYALIEANTNIGHHSIVAAYSRVRGEFPPYSFIAGDPAKLKRKLTREK
ncbi:MAG: hypothetical protein OK455_10315 [Thaumarchaeota archaeon]|nr:hypothetical protein [Nitrososphaerota archaeon]